MSSIFQDTEVAFATKTDSQLERAYFLFNMIKSEKLVKIGTAATDFALKAHLLDYAQYIHHQTFQPKILLAE